MKTNDLAVAAGHNVDPACWQEAFEGLMSRIADRFARVEPRRRVRDLALGLLLNLPRKMRPSDALPVLTQRPSPLLIPLLRRHVHRPFSTPRVLRPAPIA